MGLIDLHWIGSFQDGINEWSETPLEDVWRRIALYSYPDHLRTVFSAPQLSGEAKTAVEEYATTRIRQATEFRAASRAGTLLTAPLPLYYSFLNLTRAFLALDREAVPIDRYHGLTFNKGPSVLECTATVTSGTFHAWMTALGAQIPLKTALTLEECLSGIIELGSDYSAVTGRAPNTVPLHVNAMHSGLVTLLFDDSRLEQAAFRKNWQQEFPLLAGGCTLEPEGCVLKVNSDVDTKTYDAVCRFCADHLEVNLVPTSRPTWHLIRRSAGGRALPRPAYYLGALFILGSIVRYEPEDLMRLMAEPSSVAWLLDRLLKTAERFYPNLMLNWVVKKPWFFGAASA